MRLLRIPVSERDHSLGELDAPLTLVEYGDYQCPFARNAHFKLKELREALGASLRLVYRHFPLIEAHPYALLAAMSAEASGQQGRFWEMHDLLYADPQNLDPEGIESLVEVLKLDAERFDADLADADLAERIKQDYQGGVRSGVAGTPAFFLNGVRYEGPLELSLFRTIVQAA